MRRRRSSLAAISFLLVSTIAAPAYAGDPDTASESAKSAAPAYALSVDSDSEAVSYDSVAPRLAAELGAAVAAPQNDAPPSRATITIVYRAGLLTVRAQHARSGVLERSIRAEGDPAVVQREAVLLASNLARDEARELLEELEKRAEKPPSVPAPAAPPAAPPPPPEEEGPRHAATVALFWPLASNMGDVGDRSPLNLGVVYGRVGRSEAFQLSLGVAHATRSVKGLQISIVANLSGGAVDGPQIAAGLNQAGGAVDGLQLSVGANLAGGPVDGAQVSTVFNVASAVDGFQGTVGLNLSRGATNGAQASSLANIALGSAEGAQVSAGGNFAMDRLVGAQVANLNVANDVRGLQLGVVNVARRVKGLQVGVINVVDDPDEAIGVVTIARDAIHPVVWTSNVSYTNAGIKFTSKHLYSITAFTMGSPEDGFDSGPGITFAVGGRFALPASFDVEGEVAYSHLEGVSEQNQAVHQRVIGGYSFAKHLRVFAGGGARTPVSFDRGSSAVGPEFLAGVQF